MVLVVSMAVAGVSNTLVLAKKSSNSGNDGTSSSDGGGDSGPKGSSGNSDHGSDSGTGGGSGDNGDRGPPGPSKEDTKDLASDDGPRIGHGGFACADSHGCGPIIPNPNPNPIHNPNPGNFPLRCHSLEHCIPTIHFPVPHNTIVIHKTKVIHRSDVTKIKTTTVFVPGVGLVEPFNCKLNKDNGKIGCEFVIIKVVS
jgi:hypothetical protein